MSTRKKFLSRLFKALLSCFQEQERFVILTAVPVETYEFLHKSTTNIHPTSGHAAFLDTQQGTIFAPKIAS